LAEPGQRSTHRLRLPYKENAHAILFGSANTPLHLRKGCVVSTHGIDSDSNHGILFRCYRGADLGIPAMAGHTLVHAQPGPDQKLAALLRIVNRPAFIIAAMRTSPVGLLHFVAIGTLGHGGREQVIVSATLVLAHLGMSTFWIRHYFTPGFRLAQGNTPRHSEQGRILWAFGPEIYCFLSQSCFNRARGARRGSVACVSQRHSS